MNEKPICIGVIDKKVSLVLNSLFLIPVVLIVIAIATGEPFDFSWLPGWLMLGGIVLAIVIGVITFALSSCEMAITDKRVYGKAIFGRQVDLPLDMVSAASTGMFKSVGVSTASGRVLFCLLENQNEIYTAITTLLIERQQKQTSVTNEKAYSEADELKKYKELLDSGTITQAEFEQKKKQLLGL